MIYIINTKVNIFNLCRLIRYIAKNISIYKEIEFLETLPYSIKSILLKQVCRVNNGFHDDEILNKLLYKQLSDIILSSSTIHDTTLYNLSKKCPNLLVLTLNEGIYKFSSDGKYVW